MFPFRFTGAVAVSMLVAALASGQPAQPPAAATSPSATPAPQSPAAAPNAAPPAAKGSSAPAQPLANPAAKAPAGEASSAPAQPLANPAAKAPAAAAPAPAPPVASTAPLPVVPASAPPPAVAAAAYVLLDVTSGQTIAAQNADERRDAASLTKLMTAYITFIALRDKAILPSQMVNVSPAAWKVEGSRMFIEPRKAVSVDELLRGVIVQSGNDASIALAELVGGSEAGFVELMNKEAARLGLANTHYMNATGLSHPQQYTTANDLARLASSLIRDFPDYYPLYAMKEYRYNNITQPNRNRLLWIDPYVDGMKTGHTDLAGWCLIASAKRGERRVLSVVLGTRSDAVRTTESQKLLNYGFQVYDTVQLYPSGQPVSTLRVWKGAAKEVAAGFIDDRHVTLPKGTAPKLTLTMTATEPLLAPVTRGTPVGMVHVALDGKPVADLPIVALQDVSAGSIFVRAWDSIRLWFKQS